MFRTPHVKKGERARKRTLSPFTQAPELLEQFQDRGWQLVSLRQDCSRSLLQSLLLGQLGSFRSEVHVLHGRAGSGGVLLDVLQVVDGGLQTVLGSTRPERTLSIEPMALSITARAFWALTALVTSVSAMVVLADETEAAPNRSVAPVPVAPLAME